MTISARSFAALAALAFGLSISVAQTPDPPSRAWHAEWVTHPTAPLREPLVLHFRRAVKLDAVLASYIVRVSADNRFILYVNGKRVGDGPARGDLTHWRYQRYDLAPYLKTGDNLITATVWNFGVYAPVAQMSDRTAFLLESEAKDASAISTPKGWQVEIEPGQVPIPRVADGSWEYMAAGTGEELDAANFDWSWQQPGAGSNWVKVASPTRESIYATTGQAHSADVTGDNPWGLVPDTLPQMEYATTSAGEAVRTDMFGSAKVVGESGPMPFRIQTDRSSLAAFPMSAIDIPASKRVTILLDRQTLTTAYPQLTVSGGNDFRGLMQTLEIRRALEAEAAALCAERAGKTDLAMIERKLDVMEEAFHARAGMSSEEDWEFHQSVYRASGNPLFGQIIAAMHEMFHRFWEHPLGVRDFGHASFPYHRTIFERIVARDPLGARDEALKLMATVEDDLRRGAAQLKLADPT